MADEYAVLHNSENLFKSPNPESSPLFKPKRYYGGYESGRKGDSNFSGSSKDTPKSYLGWSPKAPKFTRSSWDKLGQQIHCNYYKSSLHTMSNCPKLKEKRESVKFEGSNSPRNVSLVDFKSQCKFDEKFSDSKCDSVKFLKQMVDPQFQKFCSNGFLCKNDGFCHEVNLLRDSGSLQSLV